MLTPPETNSLPSTSRQGDLDTWGRPQGKQTHRDQLTRSARGSPFLLEGRDLANPPTRLQKVRKKERPLDPRGSETQKLQLERFYGSFFKETDISTDTCQGIFSSNKLLYSTKQRNHRTQRSEASCQMLFWGEMKEVFAEAKVRKS